jgi:hypothetical protein
MAISYILKLLGMRNEATLNSARTVIRPLIHPNKEVSLGKKSLDSTAAGNRFLEPIPKQIATSEE